jgi:branched-chain amino acid transport system substrate-binding protein
MVTNQGLGRFWLLTFSLLIGISLAGVGLYTAATHPAIVKAAVNDSSTTVGSAVIKLGSAAVMSGDLSSLGWQQVNAVQLAVSQTNTAGGVLIGGIPYTLELVTADSGCDPEQAITATEQLLDAGVVAVVGPTCSGAAIPASAKFNTAGVAMVSPSATSPFVTRLGYSTTFRTVPHDGSSMLALAQYFIADGKTRTALLNRVEQWSGITAAFYEKTYTDLGGTIVSSTTIETEGQISPTLKSIESENVDVILVADQVGDVAGQISQVAEDMGMTETMALLSVENTYISDWAGLPAAEGDIGGASGRRISDMPGYQNFEIAYLEADFTNEPSPGLFSPYAYDAAMIIIDAILKADSSSPGDVRQAIAATDDYAGVVGTYQGFDSYGDVLPQWSRIELVENGVWVPLTLQAEFYPDSGGTFDLDNALGQNTSLEIPPDSSDGTLALSYTLVPTTTNAGDDSLVMIGTHGIRIESNVPISNPVTLSIQYTDHDLLGAAEDTLVLYTWDSDQWIEAKPCGGYLRYLQDNVLHAILCHLSDYVLLAKRTDRLYLPLVASD